MQILIASTIVMFLVHLFGHRSFVFICSDAEFAKVTGMNVRRWELLFYISLGLVISVALQMTGMFYVFSCLVFPAMIGLLLASDFAIIQFTSVLVAVTTAFFGVWLSFAYDFPTSESIMVCQCLLYVVLVMVRNLRWRRLVPRRLAVYLRSRRRRNPTTATT